MKYLSLFSGIGGFELGIQQAYENLSKTEREKQGGDAQNSPHIIKPLLPLQQLSCIGYSEVDKYAIKIYERHWGCTTHQKQQNERTGTTERQAGECTDICTNRFGGRPHGNFGDITKIAAEELPDFDMLVGGFPCQAFSIAGKRRGFDDTRGTLFFDIARILRAKKPRLFLLENVKGLQSHDNGKTFGIIIATLDELGYDLQWQVLNSKNHGVPQNRERIFIIGNLRGTRRPKVFPFGEDGKEVDDACERRSGGSEVAQTISATYWKGAKGSNVQSDEPRLRQVRNLADDTDGIGGAAHTPSIRRLTPTECERLQGFPDGWTAGESDTQRYKCLGNAVTVNVIRDIIEKLL